jgi:hypothetical protein
MHQCLKLARQEPIVDEEVFLDREIRVTPLEIAGAVIRDAVAKREVLRPCRRTDRISLDEAQLVDRALQRRGSE